jgi:hypothetical protein
MVKPSQSNPIHKERRRRRSKSDPSVLADLEVRFARFRAEHPRGTRVPIELRAAALAALGRGVTAGDLYRTCGIGWSQLEAWKSEHDSVRKRGRRDAAGDVRVFSVVEAEPLDRQATVSAVEDEIELRLGRWSVRVRLADSARSE